MTNEWTCECGNQEPLTSRYCRKCGKQIPQYILDMVIKEEVKEYRKNRHRK